MVNKTETFSLEIPAKLQYLRIVSSYIESIFENIDWIENSPDDVYSITLAVQEVCTNIIQHAYADCVDGRIKLEINLSQQEQEDKIFVDIHDRGQSFDPESIPSPELGTLQEHGLGLFLVHQLMDEVVYKTCDRKNIWYLSKGIRRQK